MDRERGAAQLLTRDLPPLCAIERLSCQAFESSHLSPGDTAFRLREIGAASGTFRFGGPSGPTAFDTDGHPPAPAPPPGVRSRSPSEPLLETGSRCPCPFHLASAVRKRQSLPWGKLLASLPGEVNVFHFGELPPLAFPPQLLSHKYRHTTWTSTWLAAASLFSAPGRHPKGTTPGSC